MKKYVKPALMALELEADSVFCASGCTANKNNDEVVQYIMSIYPDEDWTKYFASEEGCITDAANLGLDKYCKFTAANQIFIS